MTEHRPHAADPFDLQRFVDAQARDHAQALAELRAGHKRSHWIWYVLPQLRGLGMSGMSQRYGIGSMAEARAYLAHPLLGPRLRECVAALVAHRGRRSAVELLGSIDALKCRSCLTLFDAAAAGAEPLFADALDAFFDGERDPATLARLAVANEGSSR
jgi:uncharacterized protein (DUF1810 family)